MSAIPGVDPRTAVITGPGLAQTLTGGRSRPAGTSQHEPEPPEKR